MGLRNLGPFGSFIRQGWEKAFSVAKSFCFLHPVLTYGPSMLPAIDSTPTLYFAERISIRFGKVARGDIVVLRSPQTPSKFITKRLVRMEGDSVTYVSSRLSKFEKEKKYVSRPRNSDKHEIVVVPKGHIWVEGDNKYNSVDSRNFGPVPYGHLESRIFWRVCPLKDLGPFLKK